MKTLYSVHHFLRSFELDFLLCKIKSNIWLLVKRNTWTPMTSRIDGSLSNLVPRVLSLASRKNLGCSCLCDYLWQWTPQQGRVNVLSFSLVDGATEYEVRFEAVTCIQAHAIYFEKVNNKGARFVYYCSFKTNFCEDRSKISNSTARLIFNLFCAVWIRRYSLDNTHIVNFIKSYFNDQ